MTNFNPHLHSIYIVQITSYLSVKAFPWIKPPATPLINKEEDIEDKNLVIFKLCCTPKNTASDTYEFKMGTFKSGYPEEIIQLRNFFEESVIATATMSPVGKFYFQHTLLKGLVLFKYKLPVSTQGSTTANHILEIFNGLIKHSFITNMLSKQEREMRHMMHKP